MFSQLNDRIEEETLISKDEKVVRDKCVSWSSESRFGFMKILGPAAKVRAKLESEVSRDENYVKSIKAWPSCMQLKGYKYLSPSDPPNEILTKFMVLRNRDGQSMRKLFLEEILLSVDDATCQARIISALASARIGLELTTIRTNREALDSVSVKAERFVKEMSK